MAQEATLSLEFFASGYCTAHEQVVDPIKGRGHCRFYALWALIHLPQIGYVLFDTGYSEHFEQATRQFPEKFYRWATPMFLEAEESAKQQLLQRGIAPEAIQYIIVSHFHADHVAGLKDFPQAKILCSRAAQEEVAQLKGWKAVSKGIIHKLLPSDYEHRVLCIEDLAYRRFNNTQGLKIHQLWGLEAFKLVELPGHARGMLGFIWQNEGQQLLYAADASWRYETYQQQILPRQIVKLFFDSWPEFIATQAKLRAYESAHPESKILFTHCPKTLTYLGHVF